MDKEHGEGLTSILIACVFNTLISSYLHILSGPFLVYLILLLLFSNSPFFFSWCDV